MKGIVFTEYLEFVEDSFGYDTVDKILTTTDLKSGGAYTSVGFYEHSELVQLLVKTCEVLNKQPQFILNRFGWHLFNVFAKNFPHMFEDANSSFEVFKSLDSKIHPEVLKLYPDAELPKFEMIKDTEDYFIMIYKSTRKMGDFAHGLIEACMDHFNESGSIQTELLDVDGEIVRFTIDKKS